jgi:hypothetical protein
MQRDQRAAKGVSQVRGLPEVSSSAAISPAAVRPRVKVSTIIRRLSSASARSTAALARTSPKVATPMAAAVLGLGQQTRRSLSNTPHWVRDGGGRFR